MERKIVRDVVGHGEPTSSMNTGHGQNSFLTRERREERRGKLIDESTLEKSVRQTYPGRRRFSWLHALLVVILAFALIFVWLSINAEAAVAVTPRLKIAEVDSTLKAYAAPETPLLLSFTIKEESAQESVSVKSTGNKYVERKSTGKLTVYNEYSKEPVKIISNTRFRSKEGQIFRSYASFYVPGMKTVGGISEPGTVEISVSADQAGAEYNIGPSDFSLPGLAGSPMATAVYAKSAAPMSGGFKGDAPVIGDEDLKVAKETLEERLTQSLLAKVRAGLGENGILIEDAYVLDFTFSEYDAKTLDAESENGLTMDGTIHAVVLDKEALSRVVARRELPGVGDESVLIENWSDMEIELTSYENLSSAKDLSLRVRGPARFVWQFNKAALAEDLAGIPKREYSGVFAEYPSIESATVDIKPFWKSSFPGDPADIIIEVEPAKY
jgi:hypothetical protein